MTRRSFYRIDAVAPAEPDLVPSQIGDVVTMKRGGRWGLLVDFEGDRCTVGFSGGRKEVELPCSSLRKVR